FTTGSGTNNTSMVFTGTVANINNALATLTYNSTANYYGADTLTLTTNDLGSTGAGIAHSDTDTVALTINSANDAPTIANPISDQSATEDSAFNFTFASNTFADVDAGAALSYSAQLSGGGALPAWLSFNSATRTFTGTPLNADVGTIAIDVIADDGNGGTVTDTFAIVVANANDVPTLANAIPDQAATEDSAFNFQFAANTFNDTDVGDTLSYSAQLSGGSALPAWLSFDSATRTFSGTPANGDIGTLSIEVTAIDGNGGIISDVFNIVIANTNDAPVVANTIPDQNATEDALFTFLIPSNTFSDVDVGDTLTYAAQLSGGGALPGWLTFNTATRTFSGTPANSDIGTLTIDITVIDGNGGSVTDTFDLVVTNMNDAPTVANAIADQNATEDSVFNFQFAANTFADVDAGTVLIYTAQLNGGGALPSWLTFNAVTRTFSGTPLNADVGAINVDVIANDGVTNVTDTFTIIVANSNDVPILVNAPVNQSVVAGTAYNFTVSINTFNDPDVGDIISYSASLANGNPLPTWLSFNAGSGTFSGTPSSADTGTISIRLTAFDLQGASEVTTIQLQVAGTASVVTPFPSITPNEDVPTEFPVITPPASDADVPVDENDDSENIIPPKNENAINESDSLITNATPKPLITGGADITFSDNERDNKRSL
ncbi:MAG: hypothetical protein EOO68_15420, partial [Moraxellaceae bacterium]